MLKSTKKGFLHGSTQTSDIKTEKTATPFPSSFKTDRFGYLSKMRCF